MALYLLLLLAVCCFGMKVTPFRQDALSVSTTTAIKGIFAIIILFSHTKSYLDLSFSIPDRAFGWSMRYLGQLMVAPYFFYSGYGIMESIRHKADYVNGFFKKRILKTWFHFILAVLLFLILQSILGNRFETKQYVLCWIAWEDIGNSAWFVFTILSLYLVTYGVMLLQKRFCKSESFVAILVSLLTVGLWLVLYPVKAEEHWWYDTLLVFPAGMWFSLLKEKVTPLSHRPWVMLSVLSLLVFLLWRHFLGIDPYGICSILFILALTAVISFVRIDNAILQWLGKHCFPIYILQRIPMIALSNTALVNKSLLFTGIILVSSVLLAWVFTKVTDRLDAKLFA